MSQIGVLFAVKLSNGYALFQDCGEIEINCANTRSERFHYVIMYNRTFAELPTDYFVLRDEKYFFVPSMRYKNVCEEIVRTGKLNIEEPIMVSETEWVNQIVEAYCLGEQLLPNDIAPQRYGRDFDWSPYSNEIHMYLHDKFCWELFEVKQETPEYLAFSPDTGSIIYWLRHLQKGLVLADWNLALIRDRAETYYQKNPYMRPCKKKYDDIKYPLPTDNWRKMLESPENEAEYLIFCDKVENALKTFVVALDGNRKAAQKLLIVLLKELNKIELETHGFGTLEADDLFGYIAKILQSLKKPKLIEKIEELREW